MRKLRNTKDSLSLNFGHPSICCFIIIFGSVVILIFVFSLIWQLELFIIQSLKFSLYFAHLFVFLLPILPLRFALHYCFSLPIQFMMIVMFSFYYFTAHRYSTLHSISSLHHPLLENRFKLFVRFTSVGYVWSVNFDEWFK